MSKEKRALANVRAHAARLSFRLSRGRAVTVEDLAHFLRFCAEAGVISSPLRDADGFRRNPPGWLGAVANEVTCPHDRIRYVLDGSEASLAQADGATEDGNPYRDLPLKPPAAFGYARMIGSTFASRTLSAACVACGLAFVVK